jgi:hypothetical protein
MHYVIDVGGHLANLAALWVAVRYIVGRLDGLGTVLQSHAEKIGKLEGRVL